MNLIVNTCTTLYMYIEILWSRTLLIIDIQSYLVPAHHLWVLYNKQLYNAHHKWYINYNLYNLETYRSIDCKSQLSFKFTKWLAMSHSFVIHHLTKTSLWAVYVVNTMFLILRYLCYDRLGKQLVTSVLHHSSSPQRQRNSAHGPHEEWAALLTTRGVNHYRANYPASNHIYVNDVLPVCVTCMWYR